MQACKIPTAETSTINAKMQSFLDQDFFFFFIDLQRWKTGGSSENIQWSTSFVNSIMTRMAIICDDSRSRKSHSGTITHITSWHLKVNSSGWMWYLDRVTESPHIFLSRSGVSHSIYSIYFSSVRDIRARIIDLVAPLVYIYSISDFQTRAAATQLAWFLLRLWGHE